MEMACGGTLFVKNQSISIVFDVICWQKLMMCCRSTLFSCAMGKMSLKSASLCLVIHPDVLLTQLLLVVFAPRSRHTWLSLASLSASVNTSKGLLQESCTTAAPALHIDRTMHHIFVLLLAVILTLASAFSYNSRSHRVASTATNNRHAMAQALMATNEKTGEEWDVKLRSPCKINLFLRILGRR
jgi:hypothetical protein